MSNNEFISNFQNKYESLKYFSMDGNTLILNFNNSINKIPLTHINLSTLNPNIFLLNCIDIFHILYLLELLYYPTLNDNEINFIKNYTLEYLNLNEKMVNNDSNNEFVLWAISLPIHISYDNNFLNSPCSKIIKEVIDNNALENSQNGKSSYPKLVLKNPNFVQVEENTLLDDAEDLGKAGFMTLLLIASSVVATCIYVILFIFNK